MKKKTICYLTGSSGDWGGSSRVLFTNLQLLDRNRYEPLLLLPGDGPVVSLLKKLEIRYEFWGHHHEPNGYAAYFGVIFKAIRFFRKHRIDILHINHANYWRPAEVLAAKLLRIPVITHYHVVVDEPGPFTRYTDHIVAVSDFVARASQPQEIPRTVIHNCVLLKRFDQAKSIRDELQLDDDNVVITFIGQIRRIKGVDAFITMANRITDDRARFLIVGECRDPDKFEDAYTEEQLHEEMGDNQRIRHLGYRDEIENIYRSSDIIVMPSRWEEPFGLINIEAGAASRPVIASRVGGIPEVIEHGENGFLYENNDIEALVACTERLVKDAGLRLAMGEKARRIVETRFTREPIRKLEALYDRVVA